MKKFVLDIPIPPSVNHCYFYSYGKRIKTKEANSFCDLVSNTVIDKMKQLKFAPFENEKKIVAKMTFYFPDNRNRDTHNTFKLLFDAIEDGGLYKNDRYVLPYVEDFVVDKANPHLHIEFYYKD